MGLIRFDCKGLRSGYRPVVGVCDRDIPGSPSFPNSVWERNNGRNSVSRGAEPLRGGAPRPPTRRTPHSTGNRVAPNSALPNRVWERAPNRPPPQPPKRRRTAALRLQPSVPNSVWDRTYGGNSVARGVGCSAGGRRAASHRAEAPRRPRNRVSPISAVPNRVWDRGGE